MTGAGKHECSKHDLGDHKAQFNGNIDKLWGHRCRRCYQKDKSESTPKEERKSEDENVMKEL